MSERNPVEHWRDTISAMDEMELIPWTWDMEKFIHYVEVPRGMDTRRHRHISRTGNASRQRSII